MNRRAFLAAAGGGMAALDGVDGASQSGGELRLERAWSGPNERRTIDFG